MIFPIFFCILQIISILSNFRKKSNSSHFFFLWTDFAENWRNASLKCVLVTTQIWSRSIQYFLRYTRKDAPSLTHKNRSWNHTKKFFLWTDFAENWRNALLKCVLATAQIWSWPFPYVLRYSCCNEWRSKLLFSLIKQYLQNHRIELNSIKSILKLTFAPRTAKNFMKFEWNLSKWQQF